MKNNIYGIMGIGVTRGNWNANWEGSPKTDYNENFIASPFALKYCMKREWKRNGERVMGFKTLIDDGIGDSYHTQASKYESLMGTNKKETPIETRNNLLSCIDVLNYGVVYASKGNNQSITGLVQICDGINKYAETNILTEQMISPYVNSNREDVKATTCGSRSILDEAHFLHDFEVTPSRYDEYINDTFKGYTEEDYNKFKQTSLISVTKTSSVAKNGCYNEFAVFVKSKENKGSLDGMRALSDYVYVERDNETLIYDVEKLCDLLKDFNEQIEDVELYYNPRLIELKGWKEDSKYKLIDILTRKEI